MADPFAGLSPAKAHRMRIEAEQRGQTGIPAQLAAQGANHYELMLNQLAEHRRALKMIESMDKKAAQKALFIPTYQPYLQGVLEGNAGVQDDVLVTLLIWFLDTGDLVGALPLIKYALSHSMTTPDHIERKLATLIAEEVGEAGIRALHSTPLDVELMQTVVDLTRDMDMQDPARSKLFKALGLTLFKAGDFERALPAVVEAQRLHEKAGLKDCIKKCGSELKKQRIAMGAVTTDPKPEGQPANNAPDEQSGS